MEQSPRTLLAELRQSVTHPNFFKILDAYRDCPMTSEGLRRIVQYLKYQTERIRALELIQNVGEDCDLRQVAQILKSEQEIQEFIKFVQLFEV